MKKSTIVITILVVIILIMGGYIGYTFMKSKDSVYSSKTNNSVPTEQENKTEEVEDLNAVAKQLEPLVKESLVFGSNYSLDVNSLILSYYTQHKGNLTKEELDRFFKTYYNLENINYSNIVIQDCDFDQNTFLKYDASTQKYIAPNEEDEAWFCNGPIDYDFDPIYLKTYKIEKVDSSYLLTVTGIWFNSGSPTFEKSDNTGKYFADLGDCTGEASYCDQQMIDKYESTYSTEKEKYPKYQITFKKQSDNTFYITSIKKGN